MFGSFQHVSGMRHTLKVQVFWDVTPFRPVITVPGPEYKGAMLLRNVGNYL
jgi:hypothetical protein